MAAVFEAPREAYLVKYMLQGGSWNRFHCETINREDDRTVFGNVHIVTPARGDLKIRILAKKVISHENGAYFAFVVKSPRWFRAGLVGAGA